MATESKDVTLICAYKDRSEGKMMNTEEYEASENTILCHKLVLTTRSDVFKAMFSHEQTLESQTNTVTIEDTPLDALQEFVDYLYTDKSKFLTSDSVENIGAMLRLADKYIVLSLKQRCEDRLLKLIHGATIRDIYALSYLHNCQPVLDAVASFVASNLDEAFKFGWIKNFTQGMQDKIMKDVWTKKLNE